MVAWALGVYWNDVTLITSVMGLLWCKSFE